MPHVTELPIKGYAHCVRSTCGGNAQQQVDAVAVETTWLFTENGGNLPSPEKSTVTARYVNPEDEHCPVCGSHRDLTLEPRPQYENLSGEDPKGLLEMKAQGIEFDPDRQREILAEPLTDSERDEYNKRIADLEAAVSEMLTKGAE